MYLDVPTQQRRDPRLDDRQTAKEGTASLKRARSSRRRPRSPWLNGISLCPWPGEPCRKDRRWSGTAGRLSSGRRERTSLPVAKRKIPLVRIHHFGLLVTGSAGHSGRRHPANPIEGARLERKKTYETRSPLRRYGPAQAAHIAVDYRIWHGRRRQNLPSGTLYPRTGKKNNRKSRIKGKSVGPVTLRCSVVRSGQALAPGLLDPGSIVLEGRLCRAEQVQQGTVSR